MSFHFDPYSPAVDADPFPYYKHLRDEAPCFWSEEAQMWILSRYADIVSAGQDWQTYSSASGNLMTELPGRAGATLGSSDPPKHDRLRGLMTGKIDLVFEHAGRFHVLDYKGNWLGERLADYAGDALRAAMDHSHYRLQALLYTVAVHRLLRQRTHGRAESYRLSPAARAELQARPWPGNIRELGNVLDVAVALADQPVIDLPDLPPPALSAPAEPEDDLPAILAACNGNMAQAARRMGVDRSTILRRMRRQGLAP